jgi:hypothetical protein
MDFNRFRRARFCRLRLWWRLTGGAARLESRAATGCYNRKPSSCSFKGKSMLARLEQNPSPLSETALGRASHALLILPGAAKSAVRPRVPHEKLLQAALKRRGKKMDDLAKSPVGVDLPNGAFAVWMMLDSGLSAFEQHTALRKGLQLLLAESPQQIEVGVFGSGE